MPLICPRCGAQNADGNAFCQSCAQPLSGPSPAGPGGGGVPPGPPPPGYPGQPPMPGGYPSPYYVPTGAPPQPVHRLSWATILGSVVGTLGVLTVCAALFLHPHIGPPTPPPLPTPLPSSTVAPPPTTAPLPTATPTDTPAPPATPLPTATAIATAPPAATATPVPATPPAPSATARPTDTPVPSTPVPTNPPAPTHTPRPTHTPLPTDTPIPTQPPRPTHTPIPTQPHGGTLPKGRPIATNTFTLRLLPGWTVLKKERVDVVLANTSSSGSGFLYLLAGILSQPTTVQNLLDGSIAGLQKQFPDAQVCGKPASFTIGGVAGTVVSVCYTFTPQSGASFPALSLLWGATNGTGKTAYFFHAQLATDNKVFITNLVRLLRTVTWTVS